MDAKKKAELIAIADSLDAISERLEQSGVSGFAHRLDGLSAKLRTHAGSDTLSETLGNLLYSSMKSTLENQLQNPLVSKDLLNEALGMAQAKLVKTFSK